MSYKYYAPNKPVIFPFTNPATWELKSINTLLGSIQDINYSSIPSDTNFYHIEFESDGAGSIYGCQNGDDTENWKSSDGTPTGAILRASLSKFLQANEAHSIRLYLSSLTGARFRFKGCGNSFHWIPPADKSSYVVGTGTYAVNCQADFPPEAAGQFALVEISKTCKIGPIGGTAAQYRYFPSNYSRMHWIVPLGTGANDRKFEVSNSALMTAGQLRVLAWIPADAINYNPDPAQMRFTPGTNTSTQFPLPFVSYDAMSFFTVSNAVSTTAAASATIAEMRPSNDSTYTGSKSQDASSDIGIRFVPPSPDGKIDVFVTASNPAVYFSYVGGFKVDSEAAKIESIDSFQEGHAVNIVLDKPVLAFSSLDVKGSDGHVITIPGSSISGSAKNWQTTAPVRGNAANGIRLGAVLMTPITSTGAGTEFSATYTSANRTAVTTETIATPNVGTISGVNPAIVSGDQITFDITKGKVDTAAAYSNTVAWYGIQQMEYYSTANFKWYFFEWETVASVVIPAISNFAGKLLTGKNPTGSNFKGKTL